MAPRPRPAGVAALLVAGLLCASAGGVRIVRQRPKARAGVARRGGRGSHALPVEAQAQGSAVAASAAPPAGPAEISPATPAGTTAPGGKEMLPQPALAGGIEASPQKPSSDSRSAPLVEVPGCFSFRNESSRMGCALAGCSCHLHERCYPLHLEHQGELLAWGLSTGQVVDVGYCGIGITLLVISITVLFCSMACGVAAFWAFMAVRAERVPSMLSKQGSDPLVHVPTFIVNTGGPALPAAILSQKLDAYS